MFEYSVSFAIKSDDTYAARYSSLSAQLKAPPGEMVWEETTSFALVRSPETIADFANRLYYSSSLLDSKDMLLVIDHAASACIARGPIQYPATLSSHFKGCDVLK